MHSVIDADEHILGYLYWDPILVEQKHDGQWLPIGWVEDGNNDVGNTTWFDYEGKALPILDAIRLHAEQAHASQSDHYTQTEEICPGCQNHCQVRVYTFEGGNRQGPHEQREVGRRQYVSGNNCERVYSNAGEGVRVGINMFDEKYKMLFARNESKVESQKSKVERLKTESLSARDKKKWCVIIGTPFFLSQR